MKKSTIIGISAFYHDSAAALLKNGRLVAAAQEERFTRIKHDSSFPKNALEYILQEARTSKDDIDAIVFYDKPLLKFERLLETYHTFCPSSIISFVAAMPVWVKEKIFTKKIIKNKLKSIGYKNIPVYFTEHHLSHAASAFYPSPFDEAAILTIDGVGEWATTTIGKGNKKHLEILKEIHFPHSLGLFYSTMTYYLGFKVNSGEYKMMGLAPYGDPESERTKKYIELIKQELIDIREDGSFLLNMKYFSYAQKLRMANNSRMKKLFGFEKRVNESDITEDHMSLAYATQSVTEEVILKLASTAKNMTGSKYLVLAGGVALNCVANGKLIKSKLFDDIWIQPAAGDAGGAAGCAYAYWNIRRNAKDGEEKKTDQMNNSFLGPSFENDSIEKNLVHDAIEYCLFEDFNALSKKVAQLIVEGNVIGWFQGRMEFGPRALGNRSILGDPRNPEMQKKINLKIKYREGFRPFAPAILEEDVDKFFDYDSISPYMLNVVRVKENIKNKLPDNYLQMGLYDKLYVNRSELPAITHVDFSARVQTVSKKTNFRFWTLISNFKKITGIPVLINTSFNVRGEPIVCTPEDAINCFLNTEMDYLVLGNFLVYKKTKSKY